MKEKSIRLESIDPRELYGINDGKLELLRKYFPKLKVIARGDVLKISGDEKDMNRFENRLKDLVVLYKKNKLISEEDIGDIMSGNSIPGLKMAEVHEAGDENVLVYGPAGYSVKARTPNQKKLVECCGKNDLVFAVGPAGTGKTYTAVALAVRALKNRSVKRIILTRPAVEAGENLGFLPGDLKEKLAPYLQPLYDALSDMLPYEKLKSYLDSHVIEVAPLAFMRGRTLDNAFVILDEAQNSTVGQLKMFLTRMGKAARFIVTGDITQIDLPKHQPSGLVHCIHLLKGIKGIGFVELTEIDVIRHNLVKKILKAYQEDEEKNGKR